MASSAQNIAWLFVPQYYTFVNRDPGRLHMFYTKRSTLIHGTEGEDCTPCHGQQEIHKKIMSLGWVDTKVFVSNVDSQASGDGGIIVQVLGEMSNKGGAWRKFAQTFFLAEQPNGYFVLNDIFRYIKEEGDEDVEQDVIAQDETSAIPNGIVEQQNDNAVATEPTSTVVPSFTGAALPETLKETLPTPPLPSPPHVNGVIKEEEPPAMVAREQTPVLEPEETSEQPAPKPDSVSPKLINPTSTAKPISESPSAPTAPPAAPKTWASLAATNTTKWGPAAAQNRGVSSVTPPIPSIPTPSPPSSRPNATVTNAQCFIKGINDSVKDAPLRELLIQRFGSIKDLEIVHNKACAFLEFSTIESAKKAIEASAIEGGIKINGVTLLIEEKRRGGAGGRGQGVDRARGRGRSGRGRG